MKLDIVTPERRLESLGDETVRFPATVSSVLLPGADGLFEILPGHASLLTLLGTGILRFTPEGSSSREGPVELMVSGGFAEIEGDYVTVMTDVAALGEEVDRSSEETSLARSQQELSGIGTVSADDENFKRLKAETERAAAKLTLIK